MLPFYSLLEHPHRACADESRPSFAPSRRISLDRTNQSLQQTHSKQAQQHSFERTCGTQVERDSGVAELRGRGAHEKQKEQQDSLDQLLAYPAIPRAHSEEEIKSDTSEQQPTH